VLNTIHGLIPTKDFFDKIIREYNFQMLDNLPEDVCKNILKETVIEAFSISVPSNLFSFKLDTIPLSGLMYNLKKQWDVHRREIFNQLLPSERAIGYDDTPL